MHPPCSHLTLIFFTSWLFRQLLSIARPIGSALLIDTTSLDSPKETALYFLYKTTNSHTLSPLLLPCAVSTIPLPNIASLYISNNTSSSFPAILILSLFRILSETLFCLSKTLYHLYPPLSPICYFSTHKIRTGLFLVSRHSPRFDIVKKKAHKREGTYSKRAPIHITRKSRNCKGVHFF